MMYADRADAGRQLARALEGRLGPDALVLGVPRGGVVLAAEVADALGLELDVVIVRKIGAPGNPEYAIGALDEEGRVLGAQSALADDAYVQHAAEQGRSEIARRLAEYRGSRPAPAIAGREVVIVDDGIATGFTLRAAIESVRRRGALRVVVAAPVASAQAASDMRVAADEVIVLDEPDDFRAVGQFYRVFGQTADAEVVRILSEDRSRT
jgi:putative phosphoribosyl transferase